MEALTSKSGSHQSEEKSKIVIELPSESVPNLLSAFEDGTLAKLGITNVRLLPTEALTDRSWAELETILRKGKGSDTRGPNRRT
jgi:hypothetical protein